MAQARPAAITHEQRRDGGEIGAGAVAANGEAAFVDAKAGGVLGHPHRGGVGVFHRRREFMFRREAVIDRDNRAAGGLGQGAAQAVVGIETADDKAAAVKEHEAGLMGRERVFVDAHGQIAVRSGNGAVADFGQRDHGRRTRHGVAHGAVSRRVHLRPRNNVHGRHLVDDGFGNRI